MRGKANGGIKVTESNSGGTFVELEIDPASIASVTALPGTDGVLAVQGGAPKQLTKDNLLSGYRQRWTPLTAGVDFSTTPASAYSITMLTSQTANISVGVPVRWTGASGTGYGIVTAITSGLLTVCGPAIPTLPSTLTALAYGLPEMVVTREYYVSGSYGQAMGDLLIPIMKQRARWCGPPSVLCMFQATHNTAAGTTQPKINIKLNGVLISSSSLQLGAAGANATVATASMQSSYYGASGGNIPIEIYCAEVDTPSGAAKDLMVTLFFVLT
jgi:hypothetical protein